MAKRTRYRIRRSLFEEKMEDKKEMFEQSFMFMINKVSKDEGKTWTINVASKCDGIMHEDIIFHMELWLKNIKKVLEKKYYQEFRENETMEDL